MEIRNIILARSVQAIKTAGGTVGYLPDIVKEIKAKYGFLSAPKEEDLVPSDSPKGAEFKHGKLIVDERTIVIDRFAIFNDGLVVDTASSTDDTDLFLDDLAQWAKTAIPKVSSSGPRYYVSQIEVKMKPLEAYVPSFRPAGEKVTALLSTYGINVPRYEVSSVHLFFDQLGRIPPQPGQFFFERRANIPYDDNVWFSQAPVKTTDHVALLKGFEK
ncbi:MAG TPA: hypothetical protein VMF50_12470 [Candidatus Binataceae bacterium]|nr:hypothetical protein [Candidatus Binataceae bacterium]